MADSDVSWDVSVESNDQDVIMIETEPTPISPEAMNDEEWLRALPAQVLRPSEEMEMSSGSRSHCCGSSTTK